MTPTRSSGHDLAAGSAILAGSLAAPVAISYVAEALRTPPAPPTRLDWAPDIPIRRLDLDGLGLRYVATGEGPDLLLLHTLRTQLDLFQRTIPALARHFRVYALDLPGHGYSDIPGSGYSADDFVDVVARAVDRLGLEAATLAGESIGGTIALAIAARRHPRVARVVAINPYDYDRGQGLRRSSTLASVLFGLARFPIIGETVMRLRHPMLERRLFLGGVHRPGSLPPALTAEWSRVGNRRGHYRAWLSLIRGWPGWETVRAGYGGIACPVLLVYGEHDWSRPDEREADRSAIPGARLRIVPDAGHFLSLDAPDAVVQAVLEFTASDPGARCAQ